MIIIGNVLDRATRGPVKEATVTIELANEPRQIVQTTTGATGGFRYEDVINRWLGNDLAFIVDHPRFQPARAVRTAERDTEVTVELEPRTATLRGFVTSTMENAPIADALVRVLKAETGEVLGELRSAADGSFELERPPADLEGVRFKVEASHPEHRTKTQIATRQDGRARPDPARACGRACFSATTDRCRPRGPRSSRPPRVGPSPLAPQRPAAGCRGELLGRHVASDRNGGAAFGRGVGRGRWLP